ncbi:MAG TPA: hypothetical protein VGO00_25110, partial [Kofleriaceae bacterium]|nr:hypothetical protein [Kofleriaceae bacterium]
AKDDCTQIKDKMRPVLEAMAKDAGKSWSHELDDALGEMCTPPKTDEEKTFHACALAASSQADAAACMEPMFKSYAEDGAKIEQRAKERRAQLDKQQAELAKVDKAIADTRAVLANATADAGVPADAAGAALPPPKPVDPTTLPLLAVTDHDRGEETQIIAVDASADELFLYLRPASEPMLARYTGKDITGQLVAPSRESASRSIAAAGGITPVPIASRTHAATVDLSFRQAPQRDLFRLLADTLQVNIVIAPGALPDVDIAVRRISGTDVMTALATLDSLAIVRQGTTNYLVPRGFKLPALAPRATEVIELSVYGGTPQQAIAAIAAIAPVPLHSCDATRFSLRLRHVSVAEALRAIAVASGTTLDASAHCPIAEVDKLGASPALVAIAKSATKAGAVVVSGGVAGTLRKGGGVDIGSTYVQIHNTSVTPAKIPSTWIEPPADDLDYTAWLGRLRRTRAIVRIGSRWMARVDTTDGRTISVYSDRNPGLPSDLLAYPPVIDPSGVELVGVDHHTKKRIPLASK